MSNRGKNSPSLPKPSTIGESDDVIDLCRDKKSHVMVSAGGRDKGPMVRRGPNLGKRAVHSNVEAIEVQYEDDRSPHRVTRIVDPLRDLHKRDIITDALLGAGIRFQDDFDRSHWHSGGGMRFDGLTASGKVSSEGGRTDTVVEARRATCDALAALGGSATIGGIALWNIVGLRKTFREMGRENKDHHTMWKGAILSALGTLNAHYEAMGYVRNRPAPIAPPPSRQELEAARL